MNINSSDPPPMSATFGQDASFRLDQPIGAMSISPSGRDVVLASKEGLHIIDLDSPYSPPRYLPHRTPWEVADVQWSPFAVRDYWIVSTSNQKALVWNVGVAGWRDAIEFVLHAHTRAITDINFSAHHPDILATCAVDSFVHAWDLRTPARPAFSFSDWFAGATQVKWSRQDEHVIASSHDRFLHIWDRRKGAYPARTIEAHGTKIYGLDWNRFEPTKIVTCALDKTIKFWDTSNSEDVPERIIETPFPVWRARHTPFGWGLLAMPQRGSGDLCLYDRRPVDGVLTSGPVPPAKTFSGHKGQQVKEFLWRARGTIKDGVDHRDFQLVSWASDGELRLHHVHENTFQAIGYEKGVSKPLRLNFTRRNARYRTFRDDASESHSPLEGFGRPDSTQSHYPSFGTRGRQSTNIGMSKLSVAQFRGWLNGGKRERRTGMHGKSTVRQDMNPIAWMKNVKIASWDPDSLADEITQVGERFQKVEFESIDIGQRKATMSLQGPWGENGAMVYTRADFRFPRAYPKDAAAVITIYKTSAISEDVFRNLSTELHTISNTHVSRQRGCIEAIVRYLLHEQSMEQIVSWLLEENTLDSKLLPGTELADDLSSDSDDDNIDGQQDPTNSTANLRVPLAKACGALWSNTGELVCFFPQKPKEATSVWSRLGGGGFPDSQSNRLFEGFGRLQTNSPARRPGNGTQPTVDETGSEMSDLTSMFSSSSSSSSSNDSGAGLRDGFMPYGNTMNIGMRQGARSPDRSNKSTTLDGTKLEEGTRLNVVSIHHDVKELLPSRQLLAEQYKIFGPGSLVCEHNALVAEHASLADTASAWRLVSLILQHSIPRETLKSNTPPRDDLALVARRGTSSLRRKDSGIDLSFDGIQESAVAKSVRWGKSPMASGYLITALFNHFEQKADVQMLAMLSCVLAQSRASTLYAGVEHSSPSMSPSISHQSSQDVADATLQAHNTSANRFTLSVTMPSAAGKVEEALTLPILREPQHRRRNTASVAFRPENLRNDDHGNRDVSVVIDPSSNGNTLPRSNAVSVSTSPEDTRFNRRANSSVVFAASRASLNALAQTFQHSPPSNSSTTGSGLKKFSPSAPSGWAGSLFGSAQNSRASRASQAPSEANSDEGNSTNMRGSVSLANLQDLRKDNRRLRDDREGTQPAAADANQKGATSGKARKRKIKTSLHNQKRFDLDGRAEVPHLDPELKWKYRMYRSTYAEQLGAWGFVLRKAELMQFDPDDSDATHVWQQRGTVKGRAPARKVEITKCCVECGSPLAAIEKNGVPIGWHCTASSCHVSSEKLSKNQACSVCQHTVRGLSIPCLQCGHMTCYDCAEVWFGTPGGSTDRATEERSSHAPRRPETTAGEHESDSDSDSEPLNPCPTGCGCPCPSLQVIDVPRPSAQDEDEGISKRLAAPKSMFRQDSSLSARSSRLRSETPHAAPPGPETALGAMMALSRSRAASAATTRTAVTADPDGHGDTHSIDDLVPWPVAAGKHASMAKGVGGGGLGRGLSNRSSDATIRKL